MHCSSISLVAPYVRNSERFFVIECVNDLSKHSKYILSRVADTYRQCCRARGKGPAIQKENNKQAFGKAAQYFRLRIGMTHTVSALQIRRQVQPSPDADLCLQKPRVRTTVGPSSADAGVTKVAAVKGSQGKHWHSRRRRHRIFQATPTK